MPVRDNIYIPQEDRDFFILLRIGLWQRVEEELSPSPDWPYIYRLSCEQTVQGIVADGIGLYKTKFKCNIPTDINEQFLSAVAQIVRRNHQINKKQSEINSIFDEQSIRYYVVKGQEAAKNYPKPMLRCSGDIDYLMPINSLRLSQNLLTPLATSIEPYEEYLQHQGFMLGDIEVELHGALHPRLGERIDHVLDRLQEELFDGTVSYDTFNAVYVLLHCLQHFHWSGLGLRQILDWTMLMATSKDIDPARVQKAISDMRIKQEWSNFLCFCVKWLGMKTSMPGQNNSESIPAQIWQHAKSGGNMGHHKEKKERIPNTFVRVSSEWRRIVKTYFRNRSLSPVISRNLVSVQFNEYRKQL